MRRVCGNIRPQRLVTRTDARTRAVADAVAGGISHLLSGQCADGFWRDYQLAVGSSESWSTSWVGWCLLPHHDNPLVSSALRRASRAVVAAHRPGGWGYNRSTGTDADSTAWALRLLLPLGIRPGPSAWHLLTRYLDPHGYAHTFLAPNAGTWGNAHPDVTAAVGLALLTVGAPDHIGGKVRTALLEEHAHSGAWRAFWWSTDIYTAALALRFLACSGGVPTHIADALPAQMGASAAGNALEAALRLHACLAVGRPGQQAVEQSVDDLLDLAEGAAGWPASPALLVPDHSAATQPPARPQRDIHRLMTTSLACRALSEWLNRLQVCTPHPRMANAPSRLILV